MPLSKEHKQKSRKKIIESAQVLFNEKGFDHVSIDEVMAGAGLTRGAFYAHFNTKAGLFEEVIRHGVFLGLSPTWLQEQNMPSDSYETLVRAYLGDAHLKNPSIACPLIAFPENVARGTSELRAAYTEVARSIAQGFASSLGEDATSHRSLATLATVVGGMIIARATDDPVFAAEVREACVIACMGAESATKS